jgi:hypothetical protein
VARFPGAGPEGVPWRRGQGAEFPTKTDRLRRTLCASLVRSVGGCLAAAKLSDVAVPATRVQLSDGAQMLLVGTDKFLLPDPLKKNDRGSGLLIGPRERMRFCRAVSAPIRCPPQRKNQESQPAISAPGREGNPHRPRGEQGYTPVRSPGTSSDRRLGMDAHRLSATAIHRVETHPRSHTPSLKYFESRSPQRHHSRGFAHFGVEARGQARFR